MTDMATYRGPLSGSGLLDGVMAERERKSPIEVARSRLLLAIGLFFIAFSVMAVRTLTLGMAGAEAGSGNVGFSAPKQVVAQDLIPAVRVSRADIVDRNGEVLATNLETSSLYANPAKVKNASLLARQLVEIIPDLNLAKLEAGLSSSKKFIWVKRKLTPRQKWEANALGDPALGFRREEERVYPHGRLAAHALGYVGVDGKGLGGVEHFFDARLNEKARVGQPLQLSLDIRVQYALADELESAMRAHQAKGAAGLVMDVNTGELVAMVSLPDYDPNDMRGANSEAMFNRVSKGVYELGSTFKTFTLAAALDQGVVSMDDGYDATKPLHVARFTINDDHPKARYLNVPEIFVYSSNIGTAQMALDLGTDRQKAFLDDIGLLRPANIELTEVGAPLYPAQWRKISTMTISYGHGIAVSPLQLVNGIAAMVNGGRLIPATLIENDGFVPAGDQVIAPATSRKVRQLLRLAVKEGTGGKADAVGYRVGGKTGTAEKPVVGGYDRRALISSFVGVFPMDDPQYVVFALLDEPKGTKATYGFRSGGWTSAPVVRNVVLRAAPLLGVAPKSEDQGLYQQASMLVRKDD